MSQQKTYSPTGDWQCLRCKFILHKRLLHAQTLQVGVNQDAEAELCPNDGVILVPLIEEGH